MLNLALRNVRPVEAREVADLPARVLTQTVIGSTALLTIITFVGLMVR